MQSAINGAFSSGFSQLQAGRYNRRYRVAAAGVSFELSFPERPVNVFLFSCTLGRTSTILRRCFVGTLTACIYLPALSSRLPARLFVCYVLSHMLVGCYQHVRITNTLTWWPRILGKSVGSVPFTSRPNVYPFPVVIVPRDCAEITSSNV